MEKREDMLLYDCVLSNFYTQNFTDTPLRRRAWVVQEQLLANRTLHFSKNQLFWSCKERKACETFPDDLPSELIPSDDRHSNLWNKPAWEAIVSYYSRCDLTKKTDKLIAISGIAQMLGNYGKYLAGIWSNERFHSQLCWTVQNARTRPAEYRTPSWSWAAVDSPVRLGPNCNWTPEQTFATLLKSELDLIGDDPYGGVKSGALWLRCEMLIRVVMDVVVQEENYMSISGIALPVVVFWDCIGEAETQVEYHLLLIHRSTTAFCGLVLMPTLTDQGQYRRVGSFATKEKCYLDNDSKFATENPDCRAQRCDFVQDYQGDDGKVVKQVVMLV